MSAAISYVDGLKLVSSGQLTQAQFEGFVKDGMIAPQSTTSAEPSLVVALQPPAVEEVSDAEIVKRMVALLGEDRTDTQILKQLADEFDGDLADLLAQAHKDFHQQLEARTETAEAEVETAHAAEDEARKTAGDAVDEANRLWLQNYCLRMNKKMPIDPTDIAKFAAHFKAAEEADKRREKELLELEDEALPRFPELTGSLNDLAKALCPDLPYEFKIMAAVTHFGLIRSGLDTFEGADAHLQPRFYTCLVGDPNTGKTAAINEVRKIMAILKPLNMATVTSVDSGPALVDEFGNLQKNLPPMPPDKTLRVLLDPDELKDIFEKSKVTTQSRNSLVSEFLRLLETNITGNHARRSGKTQLDNCHLAVLGGATPEGYQVMWTGTGGGVNGLQSRYVVVTTDAPRLPIKRAPNTPELPAVIERLQAQAKQPAQAICISPEAWQLLEDWWGSGRDKLSGLRAEDFVKRLLLVLATTNDVTVIGTELMKQGIAFGDYIIACRERFNPADSYSWTQALETEIRAVFRKHAQAMTENEIRRLVHPERKPGGIGTFLQAWKNVVQGRYVQQESTTVQGSARYEYRG